MKRVLLLLLTAGLLLLAACNSSEPETPDPTTESVVEPTDQPDTAETVEEATAEVVEEPAIEEPDVAEEEPTDSAVDNAVPEEESASEETTGDANAEEPSVTFNPDATPLVLAFIPQENPEKLIGDISAITAYLEAELGIPVEGYVTQDHAAAVEALRNAEADISFMGALPYILAHDQVGAQVLLSEVYRGSPTYTSRIFVRTDSGIDSLADLEGKSIAFADPISESGYLYPLDSFVQAGLFERGDDPQSFFSTVFFAGGYQQSLQAVLNGYVDAAGASQFADLLIPPTQLGEIKWIEESVDIPSHAVIARPEVDPDILAAFIQAMLKLNEPENQYLLQYVYSPDGYVEATHEDYAGVEEIARLYGLINR